MDFDPKINKLNRLFFNLLYPWFPFWAFLSVYFIKMPLNKVLIIPAILLAGLTMVFKSTKKIPAYLVFMIFFDIYHLASSIYFGAIPGNTNIPFYILSNYMIFATVLFFIAENTSFSSEFMNKMGRNIFLVIMTSFAVCLIQTKIEHFFYSPEIMTYVGDLADKRLPSIYSWYDPNSLGITFPIIVSILFLNTIKENNYKVVLLIISLIIISFLSKTRYIMLSSIIVMSQLFIARQLSKSKKLKYMLAIGFSLLILVYGASLFNIDIQETINNRILEKNTEMASANARLESLDVFLLKFPEHPIFGVGPKTRDDVLKLLHGVPLLHVGYLSFLYWYGIVGASFLFISIFLLIKKSFQIGKRMGFWGGFYGLLAFIMANATMVYFNLSEMGIVLTVIYLKYHSDRPSYKYMPFYQKYLKKIEGKKKIIAQNKNAKPKEAFV